MTFPIDCENLRKVYTDIVAVKGITLQVRHGEVFGFLGPNGAGKTTFMKMLLGLIIPTSGKAFLLGSPPGNHVIRSQIGFLPEHFRFHEWLRAAEFLQLHGRLYRITESQLSRRVAELLYRVGLTSFSQKPLRTFSKGMLQRVGLAQALLNFPALIFLDEPTSGMDPAGRRLVRDVIRELKERGSTVFLNSHLLSEVEVTCDRVAFIKNGELVRLWELKTFQHGEVALHIHADGITPDVLKKLTTWGRDIQEEGNRIRLIARSERVLPEITRFLVHQGVEVYSVAPDRISLEELFVEIVGTEGVL